MTLGRGISLSHAEWIDSWGKIPYDEIAERERLEVTDDWTRIPNSDLDRDNTAHLDPEGLRYFLPALMLRLLDGYEPIEMWCIGTISALVQEWGHPRGFIELLTPEQRSAVALYVKELPNLVHLDKYDGPDIARAFRKLWSPFL